MYNYFVFVIFAELKLTLLIIMKALYPILCLTLLLSFPVTVKAQKIEVANIEGFCEFSRHLTLEQLEQKALEDAKIKALRKADIPEKIWSVTDLMKEDDGTSFNQILTQMTSVELNGMVQLTEDPVYGEREMYGKKYIVATIPKAVIHKGEEPDRTFVVSMDGLQKVYNEGEKASFNITIYGKDAYLHIFWFSNDNGSCIYPNDYEKKKKFEKEVEHPFPMNAYYTLEKENPDAPFESCNIFVVATKEDIPYTSKDVSLNSILKWYFSIPASKRFAYRDSFLIR